MKNYRNLIFLLLLTACKNDPNPQVAGTIPMPQHTTDSNNVVDRNKLYVDTALAVFLYKNYNNFKPESQVMEYKQWDLQHEKIKPILVGLYVKGQGKDSFLNILEKNRQAFYEKAVAAVWDEYKQHHRVSGQWFTYLVEKNDGIVLPLLQDLLNNPKAPGSEKEYAIKTLKELKMPVK